MENATNAIETLAATLAAPAPAQAKGKGKGTTAPKGKGTTAPAPKTAAPAPAKGALFAPVGELDKDGAAVLDKTHKAGSDVQKLFAVAVSAQQKADSAYATCAQKLIELGISSSMLEDIQTKTVQGKTKTTASPLAVAVKRELILRGMTANQQRVLTAAVTSLSPDELDTRSRAMSLVDKVFKSTLAKLKECERDLSDGGKGTTKKQTLEQKLLKLCNEMLKILDSATASRCDAFAVENKVKELKVLINKKSTTS